MREGRTLNPPSRECPQMMKLSSEEMITHHIDACESIPVTAPDMHPDTNDKPCGLVRAQDAEHPIHRHSLGLAPASSAWSFPARGFSRNRLRRFVASMRR